VAFLRIWLLLLSFVLVAPGSRSQGARSLQKCHSYLQTEFKYGEHYLYFDWLQFQWHLKELQTLYPKFLSIETIGYAGQYPLYKVKTTGATSRQRRLRVLVTAGTHGTEPVGVASALDLLERYGRDKSFRDKVELVVFPALNPWGLSRFSRRNQQGVDINRSFLDGQESENSRLLMKDLSGESFDLALDLHGARSFYEHFLIRGAADGGLAENSIRAISKKDRLDSETGEYPGSFGGYTLFNEGVSESSNMGTMKSYAFDQLRIPYAYTFEYPGKVNPRQTHRLNFRLVMSMINHLL